MKKDKIISMILSLFLLLLFITDAWSEQLSYEEYDVLNASIMRPDLDTLQKWIKAYKAAPKAKIVEEINQKLMLQQLEGFGTSLNLINHIQYTPGERDQGSCGNCWNWAGTGVVEIALDVAGKGKERLSTQYLNSCKTDRYACCGGNLEMFSNWYGEKGVIIPWSNTNASFYDASSRCEQGSSTLQCADIATNPNYVITSITPVTVTTSGGQDTAIANIKNVLNQNKAIWFGFFLPDQDSWNQFFNFWSGQGASENAIWNPDSFCGSTYDPSTGGGHAVLLVGYNDDDPNPDNHYWVMLNSWGAAGGARPNGLYRVKMRMNYDCGFTYQGQPVDAFIWQTLNIQFGGDGGGCAYSIDPSTESFTTTGGSGTIRVTASSGSCTWNAVSNNAWITVDPGSSSGTGSGNITYQVSANQSSERTGTITIDGKTFTVIQEGVGSKSNLIDNPGFEQGDNGVWVNTGWIIWEAPCMTYGGISCAHNGDWISWLGGYDNAYDDIYQTLTIPSTANNAYLQFWYAIETEEIPQILDTMFVVITRTSDNYYRTIASFSNLDITSDWVQSQSFDVSDFIGQNVILEFYATTDESLITNFFIDDVVLSVNQTSTVFQDVSPEYWAYKYIIAIYNQSITVGCSQEPLKFCPEDQVTRGQMAAFIIRAKYGENFSYTSTQYFSDVPPTHVFFKYVQKMKDEGITSVSGTYGVDQVVTREQMAAFIIRSLEGEPPANYCGAGSPFSDVPMDSIFCKYIKRLSERGITVVQGQYMPSNSVTRSQMAAFISRAFLGML